MVFIPKVKYLDYSYNDKSLNEHSSAEENINRILEPSLPSKSKWFKGLNSFTVDFKNYVDYIVSTHKKIFRNENPEQKDNIFTAKGCPAIVDLLSNAFLVKSPAELIISINSQGQYVCSYANNLIRVEHHNNEQFSSREDDLFKNKLCLKFCIDVDINTHNTPYTFLPPMYHNKPSYEVAQGIIAGKYGKAHLNIITFVDIPKEDKVIHIKCGQVIAYLLPFNKLKLRHSKLPLNLEFFKNFNTKLDYK